MSYSMEFQWVSCPFCGATPGKTCHTKCGRELHFSHAHRINRYHQLARELAT